jgi:dTMP kinase
VDKKEKGNFIVIEGLDKSGKSTQFEMLCRYLDNLNKPVYQYWSPSNSDIGEHIRDILEHREKCSPETLRILFVADKMTSYERVIEPLLNMGIWVVGHRWLLSTLAYGQADGFYLGWLLQINKYVKQPGLYIFIDTPPEECIRRLKKEIEESQFEEEPQLYEKLPKLQKAYEKYLWLLDNVPVGKPHIKIDGMQSPEEIHKDIIHELNEIYSLGQGETDD